MKVNAEARQRLSALLRSHGDEIQKRWAEISARTLRGRLTDAELVRQVREVYSALLGMLEGSAEGELAGSHGGESRAVLGELSQEWARKGFTPIETANLVFTIKEVVLGLFESTDGEQVPADFLTLSVLVDDMGLYTFDTYAKTRESIIADQTEQLLELSTPVVKLWDGVVAVPLVGTLDSARAQVVMEKLLQTLVDTGSGYAIVDITGVPAVDTQVAQHILKTVVAARLMGAECIISGIRPQIAQTVVALGIEFGDIVTKASLADALVHALRASGVELVKRSSAGRQGI
ncbi:STAS domain-containing protein [Dactylosporangium vinaceum]|uniref:STAS domain-containing protein n=1 Tax=Dactylosporangium vinaceum TaxID=53362 RepID=A0ABV5MCJ9_9ACTN|nr:STAS domain-containing protein [Dactylosporangium vinaceum]UAB92203.1 STAS domain-containing protein [Dactylosporangium vinaceum]